MISVYISILNFNGTDDTAACLASLDEIKKDSFELTVIVLDNGSKEKLVIDSTLYKNLTITVQRSEENKGFSGGHNEVMEYALNNGADYVLLLNNDTTVAPQFLEELVSVAKENEKSGAFVPKIYFSKGQEYHYDRYNADERGKVIWYAGGVIDWNNVIGKHRGVDEVDTGQYDVVTDTEFATGCCLLLRTDIIRKVGMFDTRYFLYYEDADLSMRIKRKGFSLTFVPKSIIWHGNAKSAGGSGSLLQDYFTTRNRLLFGVTYASNRTKFSLLREAVRFLKTGRAWQKKGVMDFLNRKFG
jgi:GT2 family glycosyltransferase